MGIGAIVSLFVLFAGFFVARAFRWRRYNRDSERRRELRDLGSRRHHFRGSLDVELVKGPDRVVDDQGQQMRES
jgi:hypothetical protein